MSNKLLLRSLAKFSESIKDGTAKVQDIITDYFNQTGKSVTEEERAIILNEFAKDAPENVTPLKFDDAEGVKLTAKPISGKINYPEMEKFLGVKLRGDESFDELLEIEKNTKESRQGIGSLFKKDESGFGLDDRGEVAEFIRNMRGAGIKNEDIRKIFKENPSYRKSQAAFGVMDDKVLDLEPGKRAATTLARAADMKADTKVKQELLSDLDEMKMDKGPRFFQEEFMGFDDFRSAEDAKKIEINNAIVDDLEAMGVEDDTVMFIMGRAREINKKPFYTSGEDFVDIIKEELEFQGIDYDVEFYKNYFRELTGLMRKPKPRFMYGGVV